MSSLEFCQPPHPTPRSVPKTHHEISSSPDSLPGFRCDWMIVCHIVYPSPSLYFSLFLSVLPPPPPHSYSVLSTGMTSRSWVLLLIAQGRLFHIESPAWGTLEDKAEESKGMSGE